MSGSRSEEEGEVEASQAGRVLGRELAGSWERLPSDGVSGLRAVERTTSCRLTRRVGRETGKERVEKEVVHEGEPSWVDNRLKTGGGQLSRLPPPVSRPRLDPDGQWLWLTLLWGDRGLAVYGGSVC